MLLVNNLSVWLYYEPIDMRKSIDGISIIVQESLGMNPMNSEVYVFYNKHGDKIKLLYWDRNGFCLWYKRLEKGRFKLPSSTEVYSMTVEQLRWMLDGLDIMKLKPAETLHFEVVC
jgi:transposase